jgi:hypothetical protein
MSKICCGETAENARGRCAWAFLCVGAIPVSASVVSKLEVSEDKKHFLAYASNSAFDTILRNTQQADNNTAAVLLLQGPVALRSEENTPRSYHNKLFRATSSQHGKTHNHVFECGCWHCICNDPAEIVGGSKAEIGLLGSGARCKMYREARINENTTVSSLIYGKSRLFRLTKVWTSQMRSDVA